MGIYSSRNTFFLKYLTYFSGISSLVIIAKFAGEGLVPYWYYNITYNIYVFDIFFLFLIYFALKNIKWNLNKNPQDYESADTIKKIPF